MPCPLSAMLFKNHHTLKESGKGMPGKHFPEIILKSGKQIHRFLYSHIVKTWPILCWPFFSFRNQHSLKESDKGSTNKHLYEIILTLCNLFLRREFSKFSLHSYSENLLLNSPPHADNVCLLFFFSFYKTIWLEWTW